MTDFNFNVQKLPAKQVSTDNSSFNIIKGDTAQDNFTSIDNGLTTVSQNSGLWGGHIGPIVAASGDWQSTYTTVLSNSAINWNYQGTDVKALSANWESTFVTVNANSAVNWNYQGTDLKDLSANWESTYQQVCSLSASWVGGGGAAGLWVSGYDNGTITATLSSQFNIALAPSISASGLIYAGNSNSNNWTGTQTTVNSNSGTWQSVTSLSTSGIIVSDDITDSSGGSFQGTGLYLTLNINGSALYMPLYRKL